MKRSHFIKSFNLFSIILFIKPSRLFETIVYKWIGAIPIGHAQEVLEELIKQ